MLDRMRILIGLLMMRRQMRWMFLDEGGRYRFFPAGGLMPSLLVDRRQKRRIEDALPPLYAGMIAVILAATAATAAALMLWDRFIGYVDALTALGAYAVMLSGMAAILHGWLYVRLHQLLRKRAR